MTERTHTDSSVLTNMSHRKRHWDNNEMCVFTARQGMRVFESEPVRRPAWHFYHVRDPWSLNIQQGLTFRGRDVLHILQECFFLSVEWYINYESRWRSKTNMISLTKNKTEIERTRASAENPQNFYILPQNTFSNKYRQKLSKIKIVKLVFGQKIMYYF